MESNARVEVLVAAVNSRPDIFDAINIHELGVVANQISPENASQEDKKGTAFVSTKTRGVGINRNIALLHASEKFVLFADDDMRYLDDFEETILRAFKAIPNADMVIFNLKYKNSPVKNNRRVVKKIGRVRIWNALNYGAPRIGTVKNLAHFSDSLISPPSGAATPPAESRPDSASSPTRSRPRT